jgi:hypothetical protein
MSGCSFMRAEHPPATPTARAVIVTTLVPEAPLVGSVAVTVAVMGTPLYPAATAAGVAATRPPPPHELTSVVAAMDELEDIHPIAVGGERDPSL